MDKTTETVVVLCIGALLILAFFAVFRYRGKFKIKTPLLEVSAEGENAIENPISKNLSPHQLPPLPINFTGRDYDLEKLSSIHVLIEKCGSTNFGKHICVEGMPGVGKTALVTVLAHKLTERYSDSQLYINLCSNDSNQGAMNSHEAMEAVIHSFNPREDLKGLKREEVENLYRSVLHNAGRVLFFLDGVISAEQVRPLLPSSNCLLLIASRQQLLMDELVPYKLECLQSYNSQKLLVKIAPSFKGYEEEVAKLCGHLPLALKVIGGRLKENSLLLPQELIREFRQQHNTLTPVNAAFQISCQFLKETVQKRWYQLASFSGSFDLRAAIELWVIGSIYNRENIEQSDFDDEARRDLQALVNANLVEWNQVTNRFRLHDLAREFCRRKIHATEVKAFAAGVHADLAPFRRRLEAILRIEDDAKMISEIEAMRTDFPNIAAEVFRNNNGAMALEESMGKHFLSSFVTGPQDRVHQFEERVALARESGDRQQEGRALFNIAVLYALSKDEPQAIKYASEALPILEAIKDPLAIKVRLKLALWLVQK